MTDLTIAPGCGIEVIADGVGRRNGVVILLCGVCGGEASGDVYNNGPHSPGRVFYMTTCAVPACRTIAQMRVDAWADQHDERQK